jgi:transposase
LVSWRNEKSKGDPTDGSDEGWSFAAPYLTLMDVSAPRRKHELRDMFDALRWKARASAPWRMPPNDFPPWELGGGEQWNSEPT